MDNYNYNYSNYTDNYQLTNSATPYIQQNYFNNNISNSYKLYGIRTYGREKLNQIYYSNRNYPQELVYKNDPNSFDIDVEEEEDFGVSYSKDIQKVPKDTNKIPKDSIKKQNFDNINNNNNIYPSNQTSNNFNNIMTINNNNYNKINSINIIFDANNIYNNDYIKYNNFNNLNFNNNQKINVNDGDKNEINIEKQPKDNYKKYTDSLNEINNYKLNINSNNSLIRLKKNEGKNREYKDNSLNISDRNEINLNFPKNNIDNKIYNHISENSNNIINNQCNNNIKNNNNKIKNKIISENIVFNNKIFVKNHSINKKENIKNNNMNSIKNIRITENNNIKNNIKRITSPNSHKDINHNFRYSQNEKQKEIQEKTKKLNQTKSYVNKNKYHFPQRRNTYQKYELNKNYSFNISLRNKSKEREKSNFAFLINKRKMRMFSSFKQMDTFNKSHYKEESSKDLSQQKKDIIHEKKRKLKYGLKYKNKSNILEEQGKLSKIKTKINYDNQNNYKRLYTPQLSSNSLVKSNNKENIKKKNNNHIKNKNKELTRNISYNKSFNTKKKKLFKKKVDLSTPKTLTSQSSRNKTKNKFKSLNYLESSTHKTQKNEKQYNNDILKTEQNEERFINPLSINIINTSDKNILKLSDKNINTKNKIQKHFNQKTSDYHLQKKHINNKNTPLTDNSKKSLNYEKNSSKKTSINRINKNINNYLSMRNSSDKKKSKKLIYNNYLNQKTTRITKKKLVYSKNKVKEKTGIINQKKNLYTFSKKTQRNSNSSYRYNIFSEEKRDNHNNSFKGFSALKKLEEIKKKYKFRPHTKEKKNNLKESNINYIVESKGFAKLISSTNLDKDNLEDDKSNLNNSDESLKNEEKLNCSNNSKKEINNNNDENEISNYINNDNENDIINNKSFILDLNNIIPINEKELINTVNKNNLEKSIEKEKL